MPIYPSAPLGLAIPLQTQKGIVGSLICASLLTMSFELVDPDIVFLTCLVVVMATGILNMTDTLAGFSNEGMITVAALFMVVKGVEKSHIVDLCVRKAFGVGKNQCLSISRMYISCFCLSTFVSGTPRIFHVHICYLF